MQKAAAGFAIGLGAALIVLFVAATGVFERLELSLYDWRIGAAARTPAAVHPEIVLVEINDTTLRDLEPAFGRWPWPRVAFSLLIDFLNRAPAKVIAVDFAFLEMDRVREHDIGGEAWSGAESDAALVAAVK